MGSVKRGRGDGSEQRWDGEAFPFQVFYQTLEVTVEVSVPREMSVQDRRVNVMTVFFQRTVEGCRGEVSVAFQACKGPAAANFGKAPLFFLKLRNVGQAPSLL